jgi:drug/metabolite transporter (DMT)-like permease
VLAAFLTTVLFSLSFVCGHRSARLIGGTEANFWRLTAAFTFLGIYSFGFGRGLSGEAFPLFLMSGIIGIGIGDTALYQALPRLGSRLSLLLTQCLTAPIGALIEWLWLGTTLSAGQILSALTILVGIGLALSPGRSGSAGKLTRRELVTGLLFSLVSAVAGAGGAVLSRKAFAVAQAAGQPIDGANATFQRIVGGLFVGAICLLVVKRREFRIQARAPRGLAVAASKLKWRRVWPWVLSNSLAGQTLGASCMLWALKNEPTGIVLPIIALAPLVVIPLARKFENEKVTMRAVVGGVISVAGVIGLTLAK